MALQGDLDSFALPDVLRLLAGTGKTGRLAIDASDTVGELWVLDGDLVGGEVACAPHASRPADVVFELIRLEGGAFVFEDGERLVDSTERSRVTDAIEEAQRLLAEWAEVKTVVPTIHATVRLVTEIDGEDVTVAAGQWRVLAAIGDDTTVRRLGDHFELTDLVVSRHVKDLVENGLVELGEAVEPANEAPADETASLPVADASSSDDHADEFDADQFDADQFDVNQFVAAVQGTEEDMGDHAESDQDDPAPAADVEGDLALLRSEDGSVVMEERDDALLPEPLPGAGIEFDGEVEHIGQVDGREFGAPARAGFAPVLPPGGEVEDLPRETWSRFTGSRATPVAASLGTAEDDRHREDDDRASLMRFLSTVEN